MSDTPQSPFSRITSPSDSSPGPPPSSKHRITQPSDLPALATTPPSNKPMPLLPIPPEGERVPLDASSEAVALEEGVVDLRPGTDYSRCPDVFEYLQLIGKALDCRGGPFAKAEKGRRFLQKRMAENKGLFVPPGEYIRSRRPSTRDIRYDKAVALQQLPFSNASIWPRLLESHLDAIGSKARERLEDENPDVAALWRLIQHDRVVKGLGWHLDLTSLNHLTLKGRILLTNIRAPIPPFENGAAPKPHSQDYARLISLLYSPQHHPLGYALQQSEYDGSAIMGLLSSALINRGFQVVEAPYPKPRYDAPWVDWSHDAEWKYAKRKDPKRYWEWMENREAEMANPTRELRDSQWREVVLREAKSWCRHDEPEGYCDACDYEELEGKQKTKPGSGERPL
ncbi:hypothetical protein IAT38_000046 [Cryptococcus sp. DSM 104549]